MSGGPFRDGYIYINILGCQSARIQLKCSIFLPKALRLERELQCTGV